jgi:hypothetical protein
MELERGQDRYSSHDPDAEVVEDIDKVLTVSSVLEKRTSMEPSGCQRESPDSGP